MDSKPQIWYIPDRGHLAEAIEPYLTNTESKTQNRLLNLIDLSNDPIVISPVEPLSIYNFKFTFDHLVGHVYQNYMSNVNQNPTLTLIQEVATFLKQCGQE